MCHEIRQNRSAGNNWQNPDSRDSKRDEWVFLSKLNSILVQSSRAMINLCLLESSELPVKFHFQISSC